MKDQIRIKLTSTQRKTPEVGVAHSYKFDGLFCRPQKYNPMTFGKISEGGDISKYIHTHEQAIGSDPNLTSMVSTFNLERPKR